MRYRTKVDWWLASAVNVVAFACLVGGTWVIIQNADWLKGLGAIAAGVAILAVVAASWLTPRKMGPRAVLDALALGSRNMITTGLLLVVVGLIVNVIAFVVLHGGDRDNLNIRGAALHVAGDLLGSIAAIVASIVILYTGFVIVDPLLSVAVGFLILKSAWLLVKRSAHVLLEGAPEWLDIDAMQDNLVARIPEVSSIHHVHVWGLTPQDLMLTMHVSVDGEPNPTSVIRRVKALLREDYGIGHSTIEIEAEVCADH